MEKIKKGYNLKIISLVLTAIFFIYDIAYGMDSHNKGNLRMPLATNNGKDIYRMKQALTGRLTAELRDRGGREGEDRVISEIQRFRDETDGFGGKKTSFGRNGKALNEVVSRALDAAKGDAIRILDIGASIGPEGYDIAFASIEWLISHDLAGRKKIEIIITDINPDNVAIAKKGLYGEEMFYPDDIMKLDEKAINKRKATFFIKQGDKVVGFVKTSFNG